MVKNHLDSFYVIDSFSDHNIYKENLLNILANAEYFSPKIEKAEVNISKTDWNNARDMQREWVQYIADPLLKHMLKLYQSVGYDGFTATEIWFQQYQQNSEHGWHIHSGNFTNVYYLELPNGTPPTKIVNPFNQKDVIEVDVKEGDTLFFPSYVLHKAPKNNSNKRKTIISFNVNVGYSDENYGVGIEE